MSFHTSLKACSTRMVGASLSVPRISWTGSLIISIGASMIMTTDGVALTLWRSFVDRDSFMRYQWGLGVGHTYAHGAGGQEDDNSVVVEDFEDFEDGDLDVSSCGQGCAPSDSDSGGEASDSDLGSTSDDSDSEGSDANSDSDQYDHDSILDYEN